jgi:hydrogenase nickel incorporation protein HypA/HybF
MHEIHLVKDLFDDLLEYAKKYKAQKVTKVFLKMGEFTEINKDIIHFFFKENSRGTLLEEARLIIEKSPDRELRLISFDIE